MAPRSNDKKRINESRRKSERNTKCKPRRALMSQTTTIIICTIVPLLLGGFLNHFGHKNWILYFPVIGIALAVLYFGHLGIRSLNKSDAKPERPFIVSRVTRLMKPLAIGSYPIIECVFENISKEEVSVTVDAVSCRV